MKQHTETARKYIELSNELKGIEVSLFLDTIDKLKIRMEEVETQSRDIKDQIDEENRRIENIKNNNRSKNERLEQRISELEALMYEIHRIVTEIDKSDGHIRLCDEKRSITLLLPTKTSARTLCPLKSVQTRLTLK